MMNLSEQDYLNAFAHGRPVVNIQKWQRGYVGEPIEIKGILVSPPKGNGVLIQIKGRGLVKFSTDDGHEMHSGRSRNYTREGGLRIKDLSQIQPPSNPTDDERCFWFGVTNAAQA
jgi:hypothetical protein